MGIKVTLRRKPISRARLSLYLDFWPAIEDPKTGKLTRREFLNLYISENPKTTLDKQDNKEKLETAEAIRRKRENELNKPEIYSGYELEQIKIKEKQDQDFVAYFHALAGARKASNHDNWVSAGHYLDKFTGGSLKFYELTEQYCNEFRSFLLNTNTLKSSRVKLSQGSASSYFNKFKAALKQAYKEQYLQVDLNRIVEPIKDPESPREFLSIEELQRLVQTPCNNPLLKQAALFSALTGLRFSDIQKLTWGEVRQIDEQGRTILRFIQQKTKRFENHPISPSAFKLLGNRKGDSERVFEGLQYSAYQNRHLYQWIGAAGISRKITFHSFRHTYATVQLNDGSAMELVSELLGHRNTKTTQIYAKYTDSSKREAADKMKLDLDFYLDQG